MRLLIILDFSPQFTCFFLGIIIMSQLKLNIFQLNVLRKTSYGQSIIISAFFHVALNRTSIPSLVFQASRSKCCAPNR